MLNVERELIDRTISAQAGTIEALTIMADKICQKYRMNSIIRNNEEHGVNYLHGLLPTMTEKDGSAPSIFWVNRIGRTKITKQPIDRYLKGVTKDTRTSPRRYTVKYLMKYTKTDSELEAAIACEAELDPIRRMLFFTAKGISVTRKVKKLASLTEANIEEQSAA